METLRGIFPRSEPPPKRDFLRENVSKIKTYEKLRKSKDSEYKNKFARPIVRTRKTSLYDGRIGAQDKNNPHGLALCSKRVPIGNLKKSMSTLTISKDFGTQTVDPSTDEFFLKDTIIRYPSASTIRSLGASQQHLATHTCSKGHLIDHEEPQRYKSHFHNRKDDHSERMERHVSNLSDYLDKGCVKKPSSILKSSSQQKLNKDSINETQQKEDRQRVTSAFHREKRNSATLSDYSSDEVVEIADEEEEEEAPKRKTSPPKTKHKVDGSKKKDVVEEKAKTIDPDCPDGHVLLSEEERLESLRIANKRELELTCILLCPVDFKLLSFF